MADPEHLEELKKGVESWNQWRANPIVKPGITEANLSKADLRGFNLSGADLSGADLSGADLSGANLEGAYLEQANLTGANLTGSNLERTDLEGANLVQASLARAKFRKTNLEMANLELADLHGANLESAHLESAHLEGANLEGAHLVRANLEGANLVRANLARANLEGANIKVADLRGANLEGTNLEGTHIEEALLAEANLRAANLQRAHLKGAGLQLAHLEEANLEEANIEDANLRGADLGGANLRRTSLGGANLRAANLEEANIGGTNLRWADLGGANLQRSHLEGANLEGANFERANLTQASCGATSWACLNLLETVGLSTLRHGGQSTLGTNTLVLSKGRLPAEFLKGCGLADWEVENTKLYDPDLTAAEIADIQYRVHELLARSPIQISPVFISYSHGDTAFVDSLGFALDQRGVRYWRDIKDATAGRLDKVIERGISLNPTLLLVLSERAIESDWVEYEVDKAVQLSKQLKRDVLCPIALDKAWLESARMSGNLRAQIKKYNVLDFASHSDAKTFETQFRKLIDGLGLHYRDLKGPAIGTSTPP